MALTDYTTYDEVRGILGVAEEEIPDAVMSLDVYYTTLLEDMYALAPGMQANYEATKALPVPTASQARFVRLVKAWSGYDVAAQHLDSLSMSAPKTIESDKDKTDRMADPYEQIRANLPGRLATVRDRLLGLYVELFPGDPVPARPTATVIIAVGLGTDPITG